MDRNPLKVVIVGAGAGGLCLAQGLKQDGVAVQVFERDHTPSDRLQGYRLSIRGEGGKALRACLPEALFEKLINNAANPSSRVTFLDHHLNRLLTLDIPRKDRMAPDAERPISRIALRRILLEGLDGDVHFGKKFIAFEDAPDGRIVARFEDGSWATGDVLIGADGANSRVRAQLLPEAKRIETGIMIVSGKFGLSEGVRDETPEAIWRGPTLLLGPPGSFLFGNGVEFGREDGAPASGREGYVMWGFSAWCDMFGAGTDLENLNGEELKRLVLRLMKDWSPAARRMVERAEPATVNAFPAKTSVPTPPWRTRNVTLLGDALHNMTPYRGVGANVALRDAGALRRALAAVARGERELIPALADYERDMVDYGFCAVRASLKQMERLHARSLLERFATKTFFRAADLFPPLKSTFADGG